MVVKMSFSDLVDFMHLSCLAFYNKCKNLPENLRACSSYLFLILYL